MPIVLMVDGPSLGGFVCPATITTTELWKMGQVRPGDAVCFKKLSIQEAYERRFRVDRQVALVCQVARGALSAAAADADFAAYKVRPRPAGAGFKPASKLLEFFSAPGTCA